MWNLNNYARFFNQPTYIRTFAKTLIMAAAVTAFGLALALPFTYFLVRYVSRRVQRAVLLAVIVPFWTSYLLRVYAWQAILGETGALNQFLMAIGLIHEPSTLFVYNDSASSSSSSTSISRSRRSRSTRRSRSSTSPSSTPRRTSALDRTRRSGTSWCRRSGPGIITACIFVFIPILGEFLTPTLVGGASGSLIANLIVNFTRQAQIPEGSALAIIIAAFVTVVLIVFRRYAAGRGRGDPWLEASARSRRCRSARIARLTRGLLAVVAGAVLTFLYLPIAFLILFSFEKADSPGFPITGLTTHWYEAMIADTAIHTALFNSVLVAVIVAILATIIGTTAAFALVRGRTRFAGTGRLLFTLPIMIPGVLIGIGLLDLRPASPRSPARAAHGRSPATSCSRRRSSC